MNSKFTKGPWEVAEGSPYRVMSATIHRGVNTKFGVFICDTANNAKTRTPENAANARLIAAAPTMLEALKAAKESLADLAECPHDSLNTTLGNGKIWAECEDCHETIQQEHVEAHRARVKHHEEVEADVAAAIKLAEGE